MNQTVDMHFKDENKKFIAIMGNEYVYINKQQGIFSKVFKFSD